MVHPPTTSYQPDGAKPVESIFDWFMYTHFTWVPMDASSHHVYHAYLMKAHQFIKDYNIEDEEGKDTFLNVFGQNDDPEDDQPNPADDLLQDDP